MIEWKFGDLVILKIDPSMIGSVSTSVPIDGRIYVKWISSPDGQLKNFDQNQLINFSNLARKNH